MPLLAEAVEILKRRQPAADREEDKDTSAKKYVFPTTAMLAAGGVLSKAEVSSIRKKKSAA